MKYSWQILTLLLAVALVVLTFNVSTEQKVELAEVKVNVKQEVINTIMTRSSVRQYSNEKVSQQTVETILKAAMAAPTAGNRQPWEFYVVRDSSVIREFSKVTKFAEPMASEAQIAIVVCGVPSEGFPIEPRYWVQDVSAASENILLAAHALGLGAVWSGVYPGEDRVATLRKLLDVPERLTPFNIIFMGYPTKEPSVKDKWKPAKVHYK